MLNVLVAANARSVVLNGLEPIAAKVMMGATTVKDCTASFGSKAVPAAPPPCDAVIFALPKPTKWILPLTMVATAVLLLV